MHWIAIGMIVSSYLLAMSIKGLAEAIVYPKIVKHQLLAGKLEYEPSRQGGSWKITWSKP